MFTEIIQGIGAGIGLLAAGTGLIYAASAGGLTLNVETDDGVLSLSAPVVREIESETPEPEFISAASVPMLRSEPTPSSTQALAEIETFSAELRQIYYGLVAPELSLLSVSLKQASQLLAFARPAESGWQTDLVQTRELAHEGHRQLLGSTPPGEAAVLHALLLEKSTHCLEILDALGPTPRSIPGDVFRILGEELAECSDVTTDIQEEISRLPAATGD